MVLYVSKLDSMITYTQEAVRFVDDHIANREDCSIVTKSGLKIWLIAYFGGVAGREMKRRSEASCECAGPVQPWVSPLAQG